MSIADIFSAAVDKNYSIMGESANYESRSGAPTEVTIVHMTEPFIAGAYESGARQTEKMIFVRKSEVESPTRGDKVTLSDGTCLEVRESEEHSRWDWRVFVR